MKKFNPERDCPECRGADGLILPTYAADCQTCLKARMEFLDEAFSGRNRLRLWPSGVSEKPQ